MNHRKYQQKIGVTSACTNRMVESTNGLGQKYIKGDMRDFFLFGSWFSSKKFSESAMEICAKFIGVV